jgi:hypothetical protein
MSSSPESPEAPSTPGADPLLPIPVTVLGLTAGTRIGVSVQYAEIDGAPTGWHPLHLPQIRAEQRRYCIRRGGDRLVLLCRQFDEVIDIVGFFENGAFLKNHVISIRYLLCDSVVPEARAENGYLAEARSLTGSATPRQLGAAPRCRPGLRKRRAPTGADEDLNGFQMEDARYQAQPP